MASDILQFILYGVVLALLAWPLGLYMTRVFAGERTILATVFGPLERGLYRLAGIGRGDGTSGQHWTRYALSLLAFNFAGFVLLYLILRFQNMLPWNPQDLPGLSPHLAFNTAISFVTNTNWQSYGGEATMSYFSQMVGLTLQNFVSAGTGIAVGVAVIRGFAGREAKTVGNFWVDLTRAVLYVLLPLAIISTLLLSWQGVPQNLSTYVDATTVEGANQVIAQGPVASQVAIKQIGTNGGGFFNANSAVPYENPTPLSNFFELLSILLIPAAFCFMFGRMVKDMRQGIAIFTAMAVLFVAVLGLTYASEIAGNPLVSAVTVDQTAGNMEGKEVRLGTGNSALWATATTAASNGSVNSMHDSFTPLGMVGPMLQMQVGEVIFGGVGSGFYGMLIFVVLTVFLAGLMVGRTPEYLGKKIGAKEVTLSLFAYFIMPVGALILTAIAVLVPEGYSTVQDVGPHGFSEILYAYTSATANNGSAFAGFTANVPFHDTMLGIAMLLGRFAMLIPMLAVAGSLAGKKRVPPSPGTFPTHTPLFVTLLVAVIVVIGALTFVPALVLGPVAEQAAMVDGRTF